MILPAPGVLVWSFPVKSYFINIINTGGASRLGFAAGIAVTDNEDGATGNGQKHAVLYFYWDAASVLPPGAPNKTGLLSLNYSAAEYAGILDLLKSTAPLICYFSETENYGGISHALPVGR